MDEDAFAGLVQRMESLQARLDETPVLSWGTITQADPLRVCLDGSTAELPITPDTLSGGLRAGERVMLMRTGTRLTVLTVASPIGRALVDAGTVTITPSAADTPTGVTVSFRAGLFPTAPHVVVSVSNVVADGARSDVRDDGCRRSTGGSRRASPHW